MSRLGPALGSHCKGSCLGEGPVAWTGTTVVLVGVALGRKDPSGREPEAGGLPWIPPSVDALAGCAAKCPGHRGYRKDGPPPSMKLARTKELNMLTQQPQVAVVTEPMGQMAGQTLPSPAGESARSRRGPPGFPPPLFQVGTGLGLLPQTFPVQGPWMLPKASGGLTG